MQLHQNRVSQFMEKAGQDVPNKPTIPSEKIRKLRAKLILEEAVEVIQSLGCYIGFTFSDEFEIRIQKGSNVNLADVAKEMADLSVVNIGTANACGIDMEPILRLVDENNLAKFGPGHSFRADGKLIKPPNHQKPNLQEEIDRQFKGNNI